jgi:methionine aminotransferase
MSVLANEHKAINLGQVFPITNEKELIALVNKAMQDGYNQYTHERLPALRERVAEKIAGFIQQALIPKRNYHYPRRNLRHYTALTTY